MKIAVPTEIAVDETRVGLVPACVTRLVKAGFEVTIQAGAGIAAGVEDSEYEAKGATLVADAKTLYAAADIVVKVQEPAKSKDGEGHEIDLMKEGSILLAHLHALGGLRDADLIERLSSRKITALSMDCVPRITRAQSMDVLSSQANIAGYKSVIIAADALPKIMPMMMTAAGTISAAKVFVLGAGVAGLQAIATAKRLGAIVEAFDTRAAVKEQVQSLGAKFVQFDLGAGDSEDAGGYAKALTDEQQRKQQELLAEHMARFDVVITTALIPGRPAPVLITEQTVKAMRTGSVIVDLAAEMGGNCELTEPGETVVKHGVTLCGRLNLPATVAVHASQVFSRNMSTLLLDLWKDEKLTLDVEDEVVAGALIMRDGKVVHQQTKDIMSKEGVS
jgi:proton-translocating NAD(P)+ transhydrogenase subunit alpha